MRELLAKPKTKPKNKKPLRERKAALVAKHAKQTDTHAHRHTQVHIHKYTLYATHMLAPTHAHTHAHRQFIWCRAATALK